MTSPGFASYLEMLDDNRARPGRRSEQLESLTRESGVQLASAERSHKNLETQIARSSDDLRRLRSSVDRLAASVGVTADPAVDRPSIETLAEADALMKSVAADLRSAEEAAQWLQRAKAAQPRVANAPQPPVVPTPTPSAATSEPRLLSRVTMVAAGSVAIVVLIVLSILFIL